MDDETLIDMLATLPLYVHYPLVITPHIVESLNPNPKKQAAKLVILDNIVQIRKIYRAQTNRPDQLTCAMTVCGNWKVQKYMVENYNIRGVYGLKRRTQRFAVVYKSIVISRLTLNWNLGKNEKKVLESFYDPRDAAEVFEAICLLLK